MIQEEIKAKIIGRRKKVFYANLKDIVKGVITLPYEDNEFTAAVLFGVIRRAKDIFQALDEYARVIRAGSPVAIRIWIGPSFTMMGFITALDKYFNLKNEWTIVTQPKDRKLVILHCIKK